VVEAGAAVFNLRWTVMVLTVTRPEALGGDVGGRSGPDFGGRTR